MLILNHGATCFLFWLLVIKSDLQLKINKTTRTRAKPWMFWLPFRVLWSSNNIKKLNVRKNKMKFFFVPTFDTKVTEYLCSSWVFFLQTNFDFLTSNFWRNFFISFESHCCPEFKFEKIFHLWSLFVKLWGFKDCHFGHFDQFGTINARYNSRY